MNTLNQIELIRAGRIKKTKRLLVAEKALFDKAEMYYGNRIEPNAEEEMFQAAKEYAQALYGVRDKVKR